MKERYDWDVQGDVGKANVAVRGFDQDTQQEFWQYAGLWDSGSHGFTYVDWGNVAATPAIKVMAPRGFPGVFVDFSSP